MTKRTVVVGNVEIELLEDADGFFLGLGRIVAQAVDLRSPDIPLSICLDTPDGISYPHLRIRSIDTVGEEVQLRMDAIGSRGVRMEYGDEYGQRTVRLPTRAVEIRDLLVLTLKPAKLELGGKSLSGFSYSLTFDSSTNSIHRALVSATWEIGQTVEGNTVLHQGQCNMPVYEGKANTLFTTCCLKRLELHGNPQGISYQLASRGGLLQTFDFQYSDQGMLLMYWPALRSVSSLVESPIGSSHLHVVDEYRFPLAKQVSTPEKHILFCAGKVAAHEARDTWWEAYEHVNGLIRQAFGIAPTPVVPEVGYHYQSRVEQKSVMFTVDGEWFRSENVLGAIADRLLPKLAQQGIRRFFPEVASQSDVTELGWNCKLETGANGEFHCSSVCSTHRFLPADFWGGMPAWRYLAKRARELNIELGIWFAPHLSPRSPILQSHPEYLMIGSDSLPISGGYGIAAIVPVDWNSGVYDWALEDIRRWHSEGGFDYVFTDSWCNLGLLGVNYAQQMRTNSEPLGRFYRDLQKMGVRALSFEGISPFGASRFGVADIRGGAKEPVQGIVGQNDFDWWVGHEDMAFGTCVATHPNRRDAAQLEQALFRALANGGCMMYQLDELIKAEMPSWWVRLNRIYNEALPHMRRRRLLPDGAGVMWDDGQSHILWAFKPLAIPASGCRVERIEQDGRSAVANEGGAVLDPMAVYCLPSSIVGKMEVSFLRS